MATKGGAKNVPTLDDELLALQKALEKKSAAVCRQFESWILLTCNKHDVAHAWGWPGLLFNMSISETSSPSYNAPCVDNFAAVQDLD